MSLHTRTRFDFLIRLKIWNNDSVNVLISNCFYLYRNPSEDINKFVCDFLNSLEKLSNEKKNYILGNTSININGTSLLSPHDVKCLLAITGNEAFSLITKRTQVTEKSATVIDDNITIDV